MPRPLLSLDAGALNKLRVEALTAKYGDKMPFIAVAALSALTQLIDPEVLEEALLAAQFSVFVSKEVGKAALLRDEKS